MKKLILFLFPILIFFISANAYASDYEYVWENTAINIPVGDSLDNYLLIPSARLYKNGILVDNNPGMLWGEDDTDPDYIDTTKLGSYKLTYRAVSDIEEAVTVVFNVVDTTPPVIYRLKDISVAANSKPDYSSYFNITDNYYTKLDIVYDDSNINYKAPGTYRLYVTAKDGSSNAASEVFDVTVKALDNPVVKELTKDFRISYGSAFVASKYYAAYDAFGVNVTYNITHSNVDTFQRNSNVNSNILSTQIVDFKVSDSYGNSTSWSQLFYICDDDSPQIELTKDRIEMTIGDVDRIDKAYFNSLITTLSDNSEVMLVDIAYSSVKKSPGEYIVVYTVKDIVGNTTTKDLVVSVICDSVPVISVLKSIKIKVGGSVNYYNSIRVVDKYDGDITMEATIDDSNVNYNKKGVYFVYVTAKNSYGKTSYQTLTVTVNKGFLRTYYPIFIMPIGIGLVVAFFIIKKRKSVI